MKASMPSKVESLSRPCLDERELLKTKTVILDGSDPEAKRREILDYFHKTFTLYERLFECLNGEPAFYMRANPLRQPLIFYYGHTAVFFINKLNVAGLIQERVDPNLESLVSIGVDEMSWDDLQEANHPWPTSAEVKAYRDRTRQIVDEFIRTCDVSLPIGWDSPLWIVMMGIEHERIHLETSAVLIRELPLAHVRQHPLWHQLCPHRGMPPENQLLPVEGGTMRLGKERNNPVYGWDNEYGTQQVTVLPFRASKYMVSNWEYFYFVEAGGYGQQDYWTEEGWNWVTYKKATHPPYWVLENNQYRYRAMLDVIDMPWDWPVDVNYLEAKAFCNWKAQQTGLPIRLPTEAEWHALAKCVVSDQPYWDKAPGNINLEHYLSACPINQFAFPGGFYDLIGNGWQWTETAINGFEGFEVHPVYDDFSTPTFDGKHNIFKGGCWISTGNYALKDSRYAFRRHFIQNSGIRYVEGDDVVTTATNVYETDQMMSQYIEFHYGPPYFEVPNFPKACAEICLEILKGHLTERALDLGCATGRTSFELARIFDVVDAVDFSARLIQTPTALQQKGSQQYVVQDEGELLSVREVRLKELNLGEAALRVNFMQGDACNLNHKFSDYDLVFAGNLIDRLYDPMAFLGKIHERIRPNGFLILTSPYTWLSEFTDRAKWLGGFKTPSGEPVTTLEGLQRALAPQFTFLETRDVPFVIRETRRKFQHTVAELSVWQRHSS